MNYPQQFQPGFTNTQVGILPTTLDSINPGYYNQIAEFIAAHPGARLASFSGVRLYDTLRVDAGTMPTKDFQFFQEEVGGTGKLFIAGTSYNKQEIDTNMISGGQLPTGYEALIWGIGIKVDLVAALDESIQTSGNAVNLPLDPGIISGEAATDALKQANWMRAIQESLYFQFFVNQTYFENGRLDFFPSKYGAGSGIALAGTVAAPAADGMLNNQLGWCYELPVMRHLQPLQRFGIKMSCQNGFVNPGPFRITAYLEGLQIQPING